MLDAEQYFIIFHKSLIAIKKMKVLFTIHIINNCIDKSNEDYNNIIYIAI